MGSQTVVFPGCIDPSNIVILSKVADESARKIDCL